MCSRGGNFFAMFLANLGLFISKSGKEPLGFSPREELPRALAHILFSHIFDIDKTSEL
jgi:hypothetical protein